MRFPLCIELRRSRILTTGLGVGHLLAMVGVLTLPWPVSFQALLVAGVSLSLWSSVARTIPVAAIRLEAPDRVSCMFSAGREWAQADVSSSVILGVLVVIRLRSPAQGQVVSLVLLPDSAPAEDLQVLRVWLRCYRVPAARGAP